MIIGVDDEPDDIFFLRRVLDRTGIPHRFQPFGNGEAAMSALSAIGSNPASDFPLVCFLDIKMIGLSGFDILRWIRSRRDLDALPVLMFSSSDHPADVHTARDLGAQGYLRKYPSVSAMGTVLEEALRFAASESPKKTFLQWTYRFVEPAPSGSEAGQTAAP
jgi:two-component system response regulator